MQQMHQTLSALQEETAEKLRLIEVYNERLTRREQARKFVIERNILNMRRQQVGRPEEP